MFSLFSSDVASQLHPGESNQKAMFTTVDNDSEAPRRGILTVGIDETEFHEIVSDARPDTVESSCRRVRAVTRCSKQYTRSPGAEGETFLHHPAVESEL